MKKTRYVSRVKRTRYVSGVKQNDFNYLNNKPLGVDKPGELPDKEFSNRVQVKSFAAYRRESVQTDEGFEPTGSYA